MVEPGPGGLVRMMFHPSYHVTGLPETEEWFGQVFGVSSTRIGTVSQGRSLPAGIPAGYPTNYATFTLIRDVLMDSLDPKLYVFDGVQRYESVDMPRLKNFGWYVDDPTQVYHALKGVGLDIANMSYELVTGEEAPVPAFFSLPDQTGLRYTFWGAGPLPIDPRLDPDWALPPVSANDPLGLEFCSHHTILTERPERAQKLVVDALGGTVIHEGPNELRGTGRSVYVNIGESILEYGIPNEGTVEHRALAASDAPDAYHAITWKVADLDRAAKHLKAQDVRVLARSADTIITDPATSLGVPWGFTTRLTPGDPRYGD